MNKQQRGSWNPTLLLFFLFLGLRLSGVDDWNMFWVFSPLIIGGGIFTISLAVAVHQVNQRRKAAQALTGTLVRNWLDQFGNDPFRLN